MKYPTPYDSNKGTEEEIDNFETPYASEGWEEESFNTPMMPQTQEIPKFALPKYDRKNVFSLPSVVGVFMFILSTAFMSIYTAVEDEKVTTQEKLLIGYLVLGGISQVVLRGSEGATAVYSPKGLPGKNKEDYDINGNGIDDRLE